MRGIIRITAAIAATIAVGACAQSLPPTAARDGEVDEAIARMEMEQARTDAVELQKRRKAADAYRRSMEVGKVLEPQVHPVQQHRPFPAAPPSTSPDQDGGDAPL